MLAAYDASIGRLADLGADIVDIALPMGLRALGDTSGRIMSAESYALLGDVVDDDALPLDQAVRPRIRAGASISSKEYLTVLADRERMKADFAAAMAGIDALLTTTTLTPPIPLDAVDQTTTPAITTRWVNFLDLCALAVPNGRTPAGLPLSLQIVCRGGDEATALRIGQAWQVATEWHERAPSFER
jgi:aspartyl-tRNA(Asn)/glutamyl-tRNA(Gln) amidotransferase subunit A